MQKFTQASDSAGDTWRDMICPRRLSTTFTVWVTLEKKGRTKKVSRRGIGAKHLKRNPQHPKTCLPRSSANYDAIHWRLHAFHEAVLSLLTCNCMRRSQTLSAFHMVQGDTCLPKALGERGHCWVGGTANGDQQ